MNDHPTTPHYTHSPPPHPTLSLFLLVQGIDHVSTVRQEPIRIRIISHLLNVSINTRLKGKLNHLTISSAYHGLVVPAQSSTYTTSKPLK